MKRVVTVCLALLMTTMLAGCSSTPDYGSWKLEEWAQASPQEQQAVIEDVVKRLGLSDEDAVAVGGSLGLNLGAGKTIDEAVAAMQQDPDSMMTDEQVEEILKALEEGA